VIKLSLGGGIIKEFDDRNKNYYKHFLLFIVCVPGAGYCAKCFGDII
jgi:hypothetical protein